MLLKSSDRSREFASKVTGGRSRRPLAHELGVESDFGGGQELRDRATLLRLLGDGCKRGVIATARAHLGHELDARHGESVAHLLEMDRRRSTDRLRSHPRFLEAQG